MTDQEFEDLTRTTERLWLEVQALKAPYEVAVREWCDCYNRLSREELRRELIAELEAKSPKNLPVKSEIRFGGADSV